jgi:hypothetical protein
LVGKFFKRTLEKNVPRDAPHGRQNPLVINAFGAQKSHELLALALVSGQIGSHGPKVQPYLWPVCETSGFFSTP